MLCCTWYRCTDSSQCIERTHLIMQKEKGIFIKYHLNEKLAHGPVVGRRVSDIAQICQGEKGWFIAGVYDASGSHFEDETLDQWTEHDHKVVPIFGSNVYLEMQSSEITNTVNI